MKLRNQIIVSFSVAFLIVFGFALYFVYYLMAIYHQQEFLQQLKDRTTTTYQLLLDVKGIDKNIMKVFDKHTIHTLYDETILLFDSAGNTIYSSTEDTKILFPQDVVSRLRNGEVDEIFYTEDDYEVYAHSIHDKGKKFYAIGKAYDKYGRDKLRFLMISIFVIYVIVLITVVVICFSISNRITGPIVRLTHEVNDRGIDNLSTLDVPKGKDEIAQLTRGFNNMLTRVAESYAYQKNFIQHVSHELKTPIAVLMSNLERTMLEEDANRWKQSFEFQQNGLMQMASVINTVLDISKYETNRELLVTQNLRLDELLFECFESLSRVHPEAKFELSLSENVKDTDELICNGNERMLRIAFFNLLKNATEYSDDSRVHVLIRSEASFLFVEIRNTGPTISPEEQKRLFKHFFRGQNSKSKAGIGLGLVMAHKIVELHNGTLQYEAPSPDLNCFTMKLHAWRRS